MKECEVSVDLNSRDHQLDDLVAGVGLAPSDGSHDLGASRAGTSVWAESRLRIASKLPPTEPLRAHIEVLLSTVPATHLLTGVSVTLTVAVMFDTPMAGITIEADVLSAVSQREWAVEINAYPCAAGARAMGLTAD